MVGRLEFFINCNSKTLNGALSMVHISYVTHTLLMKFTNLNEQLKRRVRAETKLIDMPILVNFQKLLNQ